MTYNIETKKCPAIKICGITTVEQAKAIAALGVSAIGVIGVENSPRFVADGLRRQLFSELQKFYPQVGRVWVIADMSDDQVNKGLKGKGTPSIVQLHGNESPTRCQDLRKRHPNIQWWKAIRIQTAQDISIAHGFEFNVDALLLDAWSPLELGGTGNRLPVEWLQKTKFRLPWWLAGGISSEWIPKIQSHVEPFGIDASSRLEISPGIKDIQKVRALIKTVKQ